MERCLDTGKISGVVAIAAKAHRLDDRNWTHTLYRPTGATRHRAVNIKAVPYCVWATAHRAKCSCGSAAVTTGARPFGP